MKSALIDTVRKELKASLELLARAAMDAHAAATDPGSKAEGKYDTRSLEASYLAAGQARQVDELAEAVRIFDSFAPPDFGMEDPIEMGALVEVEMCGEIAAVLLVPTAGGIIICDGDLEITLVTPASRIYQKLIGLRVGDSADDGDLLVLEVN